VGGSGGSLAAGRGLGAGGATTSERSDGGSSEDLPRICPPLAAVAASNLSSIKLAARSKNHSGRASLWPPGNETNSRSAPAPSPSSLDVPHASNKRSA